MIINYIHQYFNKPSMSGSTRSYEISKYFLKHGHKVNMITSTRDNNVNYEYELFEKINIYWIKVFYKKNMKFYSRIFSFVKFSLLSCYKVLIIKSDLLYVTSTPLSVAFPALIYKFFKKKPYIFEVRDLWPEIPISMGIIKNKILIYISKKIEKFAYKNAFLIVALSPDMKNKIIYNHNISEEKILVITNFANTDLFYERLKTIIKPPISFPKESKIILYSGTLGLVNDHQYIIELAKSCSKYNNIIFLVVGDGPYFQKSIINAKNLEIFNRYIYFFNKVTKEKIISFYNLANACLSTTIDLDSLNANSANKVFDSLASGKPIFINHHGWIKNLISQYSIGLKLSRNTDFAAKQIYDYFSDKDRYIQESKNSLKVANSLFHPDVQLNKLDYILEKI